LHILISAAGLDVLIIEKNEDHLKSAQEILNTNLKREISRWAMTESEMKSILSRIKWSLEIDDVKMLILIIESVEENFQLKRLIFKKLDETAKPGTIFVSNTSTLSLTKISEITNRSDKIIGDAFSKSCSKSTFGRIDKRNGYIG
jgi:3-hydroxyacyl-CoA dehydrogenase